MSRRKLFSETEKRIKRAIYREENREKINSDLRKYRRENREKIKIQHRKDYFSYMHGITPDDAERILKEQNGLCAICKNSVSLGGKGGAKIDHCHITNEIRGILCSSCNIGLGHFKDNIDNLINAIDYLDNFKERKEIGIA